jgi:hypothetical protein
MIYWIDAYEFVCGHIFEYELKLSYCFALTVRGQWEGKWCIHSLQCETAWKDLVGNWARC